MPQQISTSLHLQKAQKLEEDTAEAMMVMRGNSNVLQSLRDFYQSLQRNSQFPLKDTCASEIATFAAQVDGFIYDSNMQIDRAKLLGENIAARRTMVGHPRQRHIP